MNRGRQLMLVALVLVTGCSRTSREVAPAGQERSPVADGNDWFTDQANASGLDFVHFNGMSGKLYYPEPMAPGVAMFDYDNDGDLDLYLVQGEMLGPGRIGEATFPPKGPLGDRLYRNDLVVHPDGTRTVHFTDVTEGSGIHPHGYGMGVATGDVNNDGCVDLYLTGLGRNQLYRNNCDGTFTDVSKQSRTGDAAWSVSAAFLDYDRDGWLDLYVGNYLRYRLDENIRCFAPTGAPDYCPPASYKPVPDRLYHNNRDGTFTDVTAPAGIGREFGPALGITTADFNGDGWIDIYVANDGLDNQLWLNQHDGTFKNTALLAGVALADQGKAEASMGVDAGDFDNDGDEDLFVAELTGQGSNLYVNDGSGTFEDQSIRSGLGPATVPYTGFGTAWFDFDNDGWLDLLTVNGAVETIQALAQAHDKYPLHQRKILFRNLGNASRRGNGAPGVRFEDVSDKGGAVFTLSEVGRGLAFGDIDNDGDTDVLIGNNSGPARLLVNNVGNHKHWLGLRLVGGTRARDMLGARVEIVRANGSKLWRRARADGSYASANDPRVLVGLGDSAEAPSLVRVRWPDGRSEEWTHIVVDRYTTLQQGHGH
jgi:hypothetical protein